MGSVIPFPKAPQAQRPALIPEKMGSVIPFPKAPQAQRPALIPEKGGSIIPFPTTKATTTEAYSTMRAKLDESSRKRTLDFKGVVAHERLIVKQYEQMLPLRGLPPQCPLSVSSLGLNAQEHAFQANGLGVSGKGSIKGRLLYMPLDQEHGAIFLIKHKLIRRGTEGSTWTLIESSQVTWKERLEYVLQEVGRVVEKEGYPRAYLMWEPHVLPVLQGLEEAEIQVLGLKSLSFVGDKPVATLAEVKFSILN
jgi:hypothetical protein